MISVKTKNVSQSRGLRKIARGAATRVSAVRDGGVELSLDGDDPDLISLLQAEVLPGHARTCVAEGFIRMGGCALSRVTLDADGSGLEQIALKGHEVFAVAVDNGYAADLDRAGLLAD